jgi:3-phenylpropionate/trans-cinnamate dioxygenase ferredoxin reductase component
MYKQAYKYIIVGGGLAGASAISGIREIDRSGSILLVCGENVLPYDRPPLSKKLWFGKKKIEEVFVYDSEFYLANGVDIKAGIYVKAVDVGSKTILDSQGDSHNYEKLLLATGGIPRSVGIPGGDGWDICYYRYMHDYLRMRRDALEGRKAVVIGGGFIGSELAAALSANKVDVTMLFPEPYLVQRVFPEGLGRAIQDRYAEKGVRVLSDDLPVSIEQKDGNLVAHTRNGVQIEADFMIVGAGIVPLSDLAEKAGLEIGNGIVVDEYLQTSDPNVYAAGDNAGFPYQALGKRMRIEHWDNALNQGKQAGRNMAGAGEQYTYMPYFFSDLFEFGYEAVGNVSSKLETFADWQKENDTGIVYYLENGRVRGVMTCNIYGKLDEARDLIRSERTVSPEDLRGAIELGAEG